MASSSSATSDRRLYLGNLSTSCDEYLLMQVCARHGKIAKLDYLFHKTGPQKGKPRGYAFVEYSTKEEAKRALEALHDKVVRGRKMVVSLASEQQQDPTPSGSKKSRAPAASDLHKPTAISLLKGGGVAKAPVNRKIAALEAKLAAMKQQRGEGGSGGASTPGSATPPSRAATGAGGGDSALEWLEANAPGAGTSSGDAVGGTGAASATAAIDPVKAGLPIRPFFQSEEPPRKILCEVTMDLYSYAVAHAAAGGSPLPPDQAERYQGPWFSTQLTLSLSVGLGSFLIFCALRRLERFKVLYSPRTLLKGFSPHEVHDHDSFLGWIRPTLRTSEFVVLQLVGLDAAVLLSFLRTGFFFFLTCSILAWAVLVPINYRENGTSEGVPPPSNDTDTSAFLSTTLDATYGHRVTHGSTLYLTSHLIFTYLFTILALIFLNRNWKRYIPLRQLFSLELAHSIPARTVMVTALPPQLRSERALADYFEGIHLGEADAQRASQRASGGLAVESVVVTRAIGSMRELLERRTKALRTLENAWSKYLGNPVPVEGKNAVFGYERDYEVDRILNGPEAFAESGEQSGDRSDEGQDNGSGRSGRLIDIDGDEEGEQQDEDDDLEARLLAPAHPTIVNSSKKRPKIRPTLFSRKVDALDHYAEQFRKADEAVRKRRKGKFRPTGVAFVTFQSLAAAQIAAQCVHYPSPTEFHTELAPEPRDIHWFNLNLSASSVFVRKILVLITLLVLLSVWSIPVAALASLLSWDTINDIAPRFANLLSRSPRLRGFVQTSLPSLAMVAFNNFVPIFLEALSVFQGLQARSWIELAQLKKYHISLLFTTLFVFVTSSTYTLLQDISESPTKVLDKLAQTLPKGASFFVSYVMLAGLALLPLQLLELATVIPRAFFQMFMTRTPREHAELNAPTTVNLGVVYPQALLIWTVGLTYSIITPLILPFAAIYFGLAYLVYKYRFLFVFYRPYESRGQAWPIAYNRVGIALFIFQIFMLGLFTVRKAFLLTVLMVPLILSTIYSIWRIGETYHGLSRYVNLSQACEAAHGVGAEDVVKLRQGHPVTNSQTQLSRGRYGHSGEGVYVVAKNHATDYSQPPLSDSYPGILNTGFRRYGHPALFGSLPEPWLPVLSEAKEQVGEVPKAVKDALTEVIDIRRGWRNLKKAAARKLGQGGGDVAAGRGEGAGSGAPRRRSTSWGNRSDSDEDPSRAWRGSQASSPGAGVQDPLAAQGGDLTDSEDEEGLLEEEDTDGNGGSSRYSTFFPHRQGGRNVSAHFPPSPADVSEGEDD
ncbi:hypothetical protein JCM11251_005374 [Rhodosporidiobolus azoricus]